MPSGASNLTAAIFCCACGYDLRGQPAPHRCPECGRAFDPANRKTFLTRPPRGAVWRWTRRTAVLLLSLGLLLAMSWGWLYWDWKNEQTTLARLQVVVWGRKPLCETKLNRYLGSAGRVLDRAYNVQCTQPTADADLACLQDLRSLRWLSLNSTQVTDAGLARLKPLERLQGLSLDGTEVTDAGLIHLNGFRELQDLDLRDTRITDAGLAHLTRLNKLTRLNLWGTAVTDAGLIHLKELKGLQTVCLSSTNVTAAGVEKLRAALPGVKIAAPSHER